ncbi:hypothetical protein [Amycolatopsis sp. VC5-11]|uniref:hypothetical protein n=1 Tax=Amycolatopsis sp. VC5-11 TaxID=3120156 RepID=UPI00300BDA56
MSAPTTLDLGRQLLDDPDAWSTGLNDLRTEAFIEYIVTSISGAWEIDGTLSTDELHGRVHSAIERRLDALIADEAVDR